jgi:hypothetical protein
MANRSVQSLLRRLSPEAQVAAFSSAFQVVTFDHRRVGASEGQPPYKVEQWPRTRCGSSITWLRQIFTKPYTPKTNGKADASFKQYCVNPRRLSLPCIEPLVMVQAPGLRQACRSTQNGTNEE